MRQTQSARPDLRLAEKTTCIGLPRKLSKRKLSVFLYPPPLYIKYLYSKELRKGEKEIGIVPYLASSDKVSIDIGANKGVYTYALLKCSAQVHAFEPNPKLFRVLESWSNGHAALHPVALSDSSGQAELLVPKSKRGYSNQGGSLSRVKVGDQPCGVVTVETIRLDDLGLTNVGFMKVDVEGFETQVLRGGERLLRQQRPNLLVEIEERHTKRPLEDMVAEICDYGYQCFALCIGTLTSFQHIDLNKHHRNANINRRDYIFNFIFLPS